MSDRIITQNISVVGDGDHAVFEIGSQDTITVKAGITAQATGIGGKGILTDGFGDDIIVQGIAQSIQDVAIELGTAGDDASGGNSVVVAKTGSVIGSLAAISLHGDGNRVENAGNIVSDDNGDGVVLDGDFGTVVNTGAIRALGRGSAILATDDDMTVTNFGFVSGLVGVSIDGGNDAVIANSGAISADQTGILVQGEGASIRNSGAISALFGIGVVNTDAIDATVPGAASVVNSGLVTGFQFGVFAAGDDIVIRNTADGEIRTVSGVFGAAVGMETAAGERQAFVNDGLVDATGTAVDGGLGSETVVNRGTIRGAVTLDGGNDLYSGAGGIVTGRVDGGAGADKLFGGAGAETFIGGAGNDKLSAGLGTDRLDGGLGNDLLTGGLGTDTFVFNKNGDVDRVLDFADGQDRLDLRDFGFASFAQVKALAAETAAGDLRIAFGGGDVLVIDDFSLAALTATDVLL